MNSYTVCQTTSQFTGHKLALPLTINFYYVESAAIAMQKAVEKSGLDASLLEVVENTVTPVQRIPAPPVISSDPWAEASAAEERARVRALRLQSAIERNRRMSAPLTSNGGFSFMREARP